MPEPQSKLSRDAQPVVAVVTDRNDCAAQWRFFNDQIPAMRSNQINSTVTFGTTTFSPNGPEPPGESDPTSGADDPPFFDTLVQRDEPERVNALILPGRSGTWPQVKSTRRSPAASVLRRVGAVHRRTTPVTVRWNVASRTDEATGAAVRAATLDRLHGLPGYGWLMERIQGPHRVWLEGIRRPIVQR